MTGERLLFRKRFFGGFNRKDVVEYIGRLAQERNDFEAAKDKAEREARNLSDEIAELRRETEQTKRLMDDDMRSKASVFKAAGGAFTEFEITFNELCAEIEAAALSVFSELKNAGIITAKFPPILAEAGERIEGLRAEFDAESSPNTGDKDTEQGAGNQDQGTGNQDQGAGNLDQGVVNQDPETGNLL